MSPIIRPLLIRMGIGKLYYQRSDNPEVRARASISQVKQIHKVSFPFNWFAGKMVRDCITPELTIHLGATRIYKEFIFGSFKEPQLKLLRDSIYDRKAKAEAKDKARLGRTIFSLVEALGLTNLSQ